MEGSQVSSSSSSSSKHQRVAAADLPWLLLVTQERLPWLLLLKQEREVKHVCSSKCAHSHQFAAH
jgi:hypothetical protein